MLSVYHWPIHSQGLIESWHTDTWYVMVQRLISHFKLAGGMWNIFSSYLHLAT